MNSTIPSDITLVGQGAGDHILTGGNFHNVLVSEGGQTAMSAVGGATTFVHVGGGPGNVDIWADFDPSVGDKVTWSNTLSIAQSGLGTVSDPNLGIATTGLVLVFDDGSKVGIPTIQDHTALDPSWVLPAATLASPAVPTPATPQSAPAPAPSSGGLSATVTPAPQEGPVYIAPALNDQGDPSGTVTVEGANPGGSIMAFSGNTGNAVLLGGPGNDYLVGSPQPVIENVLNGGGGTNTLTGKGATVFVHSPGATDVVTDWNQNDHITLDKSVTLNKTLTGQGVITDPQAGLSPATGLILVFDDHNAAGAVTGHSEMALAHVTATAADPSWFV